MSRRARLRRLFLVAVIGVGLAACVPQVSGGGGSYPPPPPEVAAAIQANFGDLGPYYVDCFTGIAWRETRYNYGETGSGGQYLGLFQIRASSAVWANMAFNLGRPLVWQDPMDNAIAARSMFQVSGFSPWNATRGACR